MEPININQTSSNSVEPQQNNIGETPKTRLTQKLLLFGVVVVIILFVIVAGFQFLRTENSQHLQDKNSQTQKTYSNKKYGIEFAYPANWSARESSDGQYLYFFKTETASNAKMFASVVVEDLNVGKAGSPRYVSPQEYFNYYFESYTVRTAMQFDKVPVIRATVQGGDDRYVIYTNDRQLSFVLYAGSAQNPTEYTSGDDAAMEGVIKTLKLTNSTDGFVKVTPNVTSSIQNQTPAISVTENQIQFLNGQILSINDFPDAVRVSADSSFGSSDRINGAIISSDGKWIAVATGGAAHDFGWMYEVSTKKLTPVVFSYGGGVAVKNWNNNQEVVFIKTTAKPDTYEVAINVSNLPQYPL